MVFFNIDPEIIRYSPSETHILDVDVTPYDDGHRLHVSLEFTPFLERPIIELLITDQDGVEAGSATIVEPPFWKQKLTMHIKSPDPVGTYMLIVKLLFIDVDIQEERTVEFNIHGASYEKD